jgi:anti-sigma regulatory factor (Ser/Thr protein kinase)
LDEILLSLPCDARWRGVAHLVMSGLAARLDLTVETLEDWQIALEELLGRQHSPDGRVELVFRASPDELEARFGPSCSGLIAEFERDEDGVSLHRVLSTLADEVELVSSDDEQWIVLRKAIVRAGGTR